MQTVSIALQAVMDAGINNNPNDPTRDWCTVYEFYEHDYVPDPTNGFEPANATKRFAHINLTWNSLAYIREAQSRSDTSRFVSKTANQATATFSNVDRVMSAWIASTDVEGMYFVIRELSRSVTDSSIVLFSGRIKKPVEFNRIDATFYGESILGAFDNIQVPGRTYSPDDPDGRQPSDPLFKGFRIVALHGSFDRTRTETRRKFLIFRKTVEVHYSDSWSSRDATPLGNPVQECFGRVQAELTPIAFADIGGAAKGLWVASNGKISAVDNIRNPEDPNRQPNNITVHLGDPGGTGTNAQIAGQPANTGDQQFPGAGFFSDTAYIGAGIPNGDPESVEDIVTVIAIIRGRLVPLPDGSGDFSLTGWTDSGPYLTRFLLTDDEFGMLDPAFVADPACIETADFCAEPINDSANSERVFIPNTDLPQAGTAFHLHRSTGRIDARSILFYDFGTGTEPELLDADYEGFDETDIPGTFSLITRLQGRYTTNFIITEKVNLSDLLYDTVMRSYRGYLVVNSKGQIEPRCEKQGDNALLRSSSIVGATSIAVDDVEWWKTNLLLRGKVVLGNNLPSGVTTSEVRKVTNAQYSTAGNSITLVAGVTGTITATASGATLSGGSTSVAASGGVTIGGSPAPGDIVTVTIDGIAIQHVLEPYDTTGTVARMLMYRINANTRLKRYIKASWVDSTPNLVTIKSKLGTLTLAEALVYAHTGPTASPTVAPTLTPGSGGSLPAGTLYAAYSYETSIGETYVSPVQSVVVTLNQKITTSTISPPAGSTVNWYLSVEAGSTELAYVDNNNGAALDILALPDPDAPRTPLYNNTAEECLRVMMSFSDAGKNADGTVSVKLKQAGLTRNNINKNSFKWPLGGKQSSINQAIIEYVDASNDFAKTTATINDKARQTKVGKPTPIKINGAAIDNYNQAYRIANAALAKNSEGNWFGSLTTSDPNAMLLEEGDLFCASDESGGFVNIVLRVEEATVHADRSTTITGRLYSTEMFSDYVRKRTISLPTTLKYVQTRPSVFELVNGPPIRDEDGQTPGLYGFSTFDDSVLGDYRGSALYADYGDKYKKQADFDAIATMGTCGTILPTVSNAGWDRTSTLDVTLIHGTLESKTEEELRADSKVNLVAIGNKTDGYEYVQFSDVIDNGRGSYTIGTFIRGAYGTDDIRMAHHADDNFILMDAAKFIPIDPLRLDTEYPYKAVTRNENVSDAISKNFTWDGGTVRTLAPTNVNGDRDSINNLLIRLTRQSRYGHGLKPFSDVPLGEEVEKYLVRIMNGSSFILPSGKERSIEVFRDEPQPAALVTYASDAGKFDYIDENTLSVSGTDININARALQDIRQAENFVEATLSAGGDASASLGLVDKYSLENKYSIYILGGLASGIYVKIGSDPLEFVADRPTSGVARCRIQLTGKGVNFYVEYSGDGTPPVYVSSVAPSYPLTPVVIVESGSSGGGGGAAHAEKVILTTKGDPMTTYFASQQAEDGFTPGDPVKMRVYEVSSVVGAGAYREVTL